MLFAYLPNTDYLRKARTIRLAVRHRKADQEMSDLVSLLPDHRAFMKSDGEFPQLLGRDP